jgi:outer membrane lipoprotein SlyB
MNVKRSTVTSASLVVAIVTIFTSAWGATVRIGIVEQAQRITLQSSGAGGAVVGGVIGYNLGSGNSQSKKRRRAIIGGMAGSAASKKSQPGMEYTVKFTDGSTMAIVSNQMGLAVGSCVSVEDSGKSVNIRGQDAAACDPKAAEVVKDLQDELEDDADECAAAKQELLAAKTAEEVELASIKARILCN